MINKSTQLDFESEIDLIEIYRKLFKGKWIIFIFSIFFFILGVLYTNTNTNYKNDIYDISLEISPASQSQFSKYINLNDILSNIPLPSSIKTEVGPLIEKFYKVTPDSVFNEFVIQYNQRQEIVKILSKSPFSSSFINDSNYEDQILSKAKEFEIAQEGDEINSLFLLHFKWPVKKDIFSLGNLTIKNTLLSVKETILDDLNFIKLYVENQKQRLKTQYKKDIISLSNNIYKENKSRLIFLEENLEIAKSLEIYDNSHVENAFNDNFYLRGSKAIEKEIEILSNRPKENSLILSKEYLSLSNQLNDIENDETIQQFANAIDLFSKESINNWINYNLAFAEIVNLKKKKIKVFVFAIMLGFFIGCFVVLFREAIIQRKKQFPL